MDCYANPINISVMNSQPTSVTSSNCCTMAIMVGAPLSLFTRFIFYDKCWWFCLKLFDRYGFQKAVKSFWAFSLNSTLNNLKSMSLSRKGWCLSIAEFAGGNNKILPYWLTKFSGILDMLTNWPINKIPFFLSMNFFPTFD